MAKNWMKLKPGVKYAVRPLPPKGKKLSTRALRAFEHEFTADALEARLVSHLAGRMVEFNAQKLAAVQALVKKHRLMALFYGVTK